MKNSFFAALALAALTTAGALAQTAPTTGQPKQTTEERAARRAGMKAKLENMSPEERKAFMETRRQERLNKMTPEQREAFEQAKRDKKSTKKAATSETRKVRKSVKKAAETSEIRQDKPAADRQKLAAMTPEERNSFREHKRRQLKEKYEAMTPAQKAQAEKRMEARREGKKIRRNG